MMYVSWRRHLFSTLLYLQYLYTDDTTTSYSLLPLDTTAATTVMSSGLPPDVARPLPCCQHEPVRRQEGHGQRLT